MKPIIGANHRLSRIQIPLPVDETGEYVVDEDGKPLKNRKPVVIIVPRADCIPRKQFKQLIADITAVDDMKDEDGEPISLVEKQFQIELVTLRPWVTDAQFDLLSDLALGELRQITRRINEESEITLPELLASTDSSKSSARPSKRTSSASDSESETLETS
jgi:hypothetical protein